MKIKSFSDPRPHIIIDDFVPKRLLPVLMNEIKSLEPHLIPGLVGKNGVEVLDKDLKNNGIVRMDQMFSGRRDDSFILKLISNTLWKKGELFNYLKDHKDPIFQQMHLSTKDWTSLSYYGNGDFYEWHEDVSISTTFVLLLSKEPVKFTGGEFELMHNDNIKTIPFRNNRVIIFPSRTKHRVLPVVLEDNEYMNGRFSVQNWNGGY